MSILNRSRSIVNVNRILTNENNLLRWKWKTLIRHFSESGRLNCPPNLQATPVIGLADELLDIRANGLEAGQPMVLRSEVYSECGRFGFESHARYTADQNGQVSVKSDPSLGGTYSGIEPMGLLSSVQPMSVYASRNPRLIKYNTLMPLVYNLSLHMGEGGNGDMLDSISVERHYVAPYVERKQVECGRAKGILYLPRKDGGSLLPLLIDMGGLAAKFSSDRAALLASHGFGVFAFHYYNTLENDLKARRNAYFDCRALMDIINFAKEHPELDENRIGLSGACYGGVLAINAVARIPDLPIRCMGIQRGKDYLAMRVGMVTTTGERFDPAPHPESYSRVTKKDDGRDWFEFDFDHYVHQVDCRGDFVAPVENIKIPVMFLVCGDDRQCPSKKCMTRAASRIRAAGKDDLLEYHHLEGAGHLLNSPYLPHCRKSNIIMPIREKPMMVDWGGDPVLHAKAQVTAWTKSINFYRRHLEAEIGWRQDWHDDNEESWETISENPLKVHKIF